MNNLATFFRESRVARFFIPFGIILIVFSIFLFIAGDHNKNYLATEAVVSKTELVKEGTYDSEGNKLTDDSYEDAPYQYSYKANDPTIIAQEIDNELIGGTPIGKTSANNGEYLKVTVTIWLEGWSALLKGAGGQTDISIWDEESYVAKSFNVGMTFGVALHNDNE